MDRASEKTKKKEKKINTGKKKRGSSSRRRRRISGYRAYLELQQNIRMAQLCFVTEKEGKKKKKKSRGREKNMAFKRNSDVWFS